MKALSAIFAWGKVCWTDMNNNDLVTGNTWHVEFKHVEDRKIIKFKTWLFKHRIIHRPTFDIAVHLPRKWECTVCMVEHRKLSLTNIEWIVNNHLTMHLNIHNEQTVWIGVAPLFRIWMPCIEKKNLFNVWNKVIYKDWIKPVHFMRGDMRVIEWKLFYFDLNLYARVQLAIIQYLF